MHPVWNGLYVVAAVAIAVLYQMGLVPGGNAVFLAAALAAIFTGHLLVVSTEPRDETARPRHTAASSLSYVLCLAVAGLVTAQAFLTI